MARSASRAPGGTTPGVAGERTLRVKGCRCPDSWWAAALGVCPGKFERARKFLFDPATAYITKPRGGREFCRARNCLRNGDGRRHGHSKLQLGGKVRLRLP